MITDQEILAGMSDDQREAYLAKKINNGHRMNYRLELASKQREGIALKQFVPNNVSNLKDKLFLEDGFANYMVEEHEIGIFHVLQENRTFRSSTGERLSRASVQKYGIESYNSMNAHNGFSGMTVYILHNPNLPLTEEQQQFCIEKGFEIKPV